MYKECDLCEARHYSITKNIVIDVVTVAVVYNQTNMKVS